MHAHVARAGRATAGRRCERRGAGVHDAPVCLLPGLAPVARWRGHGCLHAVRRCSSPPPGRALEARQCVARAWSQAQLHSVLPWIRGCAAPSPCPGPCACCRGGGRAWRPGACWPDRWKSRPGAAAQVSAAWRTALAQRQLAHWRAGGGGHVVQGQAGGACMAACRLGPPPSCRASTAARRLPADPAGCSSAAPWTARSRWFASWSQTCTSMGTRRR